MDKSKALIAGYSDKPSNLCLAAARISTTKGSAREIFDESMEREDTSLVKKVLSMGHHSVAEHVYFNIIFDNISVIVEQFIIEFRLASFTVKSRRYVDYSNQGFVSPRLRFKDDLDKSEKADLEKDFEKGLSDLFDSYSKLTELGIPREDARFILPYAFRSNFYCTVNARELMKIIYSACYGRGSKYPEIKALGEMLLDQAKAIFPEPFEMLDKIASFKDEIPDSVSGIMEKYGLNRAPSPDKKAELISYTEDASMMMVLSELASFGVSPEDARTAVDSEPDLYKSIKDSILLDGRPRALESVNFGFKINRITLAGLTHLVRHRVQSINIPPLSKGIRYDDFIFPESIKENEKAFEIYNLAYINHMKLCKKFEAVLNHDDLVYLALAGMRMDIFTSMNARELFHFFRLRTCMRAQWEIRDIAFEMLSVLREKEPDIFKFAGPGCFMDGVCPEGKSTCGRMTEVREIISKL